MGDSLGEQIWQKAEEIKTSSEQMAMKTKIISDSGINFAKTVSGGMPEFSKGVAEDVIKSGVHFGSGFADKFSRELDKNLGETSVISSIGRNIKDSMKNI